jgi:hypothetical protein
MSIKLRLALPLGLMLAGRSLGSLAQRRAFGTEITQRTQAQAAQERSEAAIRRNLPERARLGRGLTRGGGLANFQPRAQELGAGLTVRSEPSRGPPVKPAFSLVFI